MATKAKLHPRNQHREGYDFVRLVAHTPELEAFTISNPVGQTTIDFQDVWAVRMLNRALLKAYYNIDFWDIPANYLCPRIPGRVEVGPTRLDAEGTTGFVAAQVHADARGTGGRCVWPPRRIRALC